MNGGTRSYELSRRLRSWGVDVTVITTDQKPDITDVFSWRDSTVDGIPVRWFGNPYSNELGFWHRMLSFFRFMFAATWELFRQDADVVYATSTPLTVAVPAVIMKIIKRRPMVFEVRDAWPTVPIAMGELRNPVLVLLARILERVAYYFADEIVALSPDMEKEIRKRCGKNQKIVVIPNGCDEAFGNVTQEEVWQVRQNYRWDASTKIILYAGTFGRVNGVSYLVELAYEIKKRDSQVIVVACGKGRELEHVTQLASDLGVLDNTFQIIDPVTKKRLPSLVAASSIVASTVIDVPELAANSANKVFDGWAASKPVLINHLGWLDDIIKQNNVGLPLYGQDVSLAADEIVSFLHDQERYNTMCDAAGKIARNRFDRTSQSRDVYSLLMNVSGSSQNKIKTKIPFGKAA